MAHTKIQIHFELSPHSSARVSMASRVDIDALKARIKRWEHEFQTTRGRRPVRADVEADVAVKTMYSEYKALSCAPRAARTPERRATAAVSRAEDDANVKTVSYRDIQRGLAATESGGDDDDEAIEATPVKAARTRPATELSLTPRRSPRLVNRTRNDENGCVPPSVAMGAVAQTSVMRRPLVETTVSVKTDFASRVGGGATSTKAFASLKSARERAIGEDGKTVPLLCEATIAAMRDGANRVKRETMELGVSAMLNEDKTKKRRKKADAPVVVGATAASAVAVARTGGNASTSAARDAGAATSEPTKPKTAADIRAEFEAEQKRAKLKASKGNFIKTNLKRTYKSKVKNGARKKAATHYRYGGGRRGKNKAEDREDAPKVDAEPPSIWASGDWTEPPPEADVAMVDKLTPAKKALKAREAADGLAREYITAAAAECAKAEAERRARLEVGPEMQAAIALAARDPSEENLTDVLKRGFGHDGFRPGQLEIVQRVLRGENTLAMLPTGAGKSLTYQLPAMLLPGLTLVVSPLLALMADQLDSLPPSLPGGSLRSDMHRNDMWETLTRLRAGEFKVLFVSPERLLNEHFVNDLLNLQGGVSLAVIDEAHCVSEWSHNFRPAYHRLGRILGDRVQAKTTLALTATATKKTELSLIKQLGIPSDGVLRNVRVRDNLILSVMRVPELAREKTLLHMLKYDELLQTGSVIVYTSFRADADKVATYLYDNGIKAKSYHAKQEPAQRRQTQSEFMMSKIRVVVATIAFGMGLDKSDVRAVINFALPRSPEAYIQQAGRAGRDGAPAACVTFIDPVDYLRSRSLTYADGVDRPSITKLLQHIFQSGPVSAKESTGENEAWTPCVGAIAANEMEIKLDMRIEAIETVLSCLDLWGEGLIDIRSRDPSAVNELDAQHAKGLIRVLPDLRATCEAEFYGRSPAEIGEECPLAAAIAKLVPKPKASKYKFKIVDAAMLMQSGFDDVAAQLKALSKHDQVRYELSDRAVGFEIIRQPPKDIIPLATALADHCRDIEACSVGKIDALYIAMDNAANAENEDAQGELLRTCLAEYLDENTDMLPSPPDVVKCESTLLGPDVKTLLAHRSGGKGGGSGMMSARAVARILHGLNSPAFPSKEWARHHTWKRHNDVDFSVILARAEEAIASARGIGKKT